MNFKLNNHQAQIEITEGNNKLFLDFLSAPLDYLIAEDDSNISLFARKNVKCISFIKDESFFAIFKKDSAHKISLTLKINFDILIEAAQDKFLFGVGDTNYCIDFDGCIYVLDDSNNLSLTLNIDSASINIKKISNDFTEQNVKIMSLSDPFLIDQTSIMPEFSIATFDDFNFTMPRLIRHGIPVISTVPSMITNTSSQADVDYYNQGLGPTSKKIYLRIICNSILESLSYLEESPNLQLKVYLPNGLDTVKAATYQPMYFLSSDATNNISIYYSTFDFYTQGTYNNIDYVDGFMYFDVQVPLTVQKYMPIQFDFTV